MKVKLLLTILAFCCFCVMLNIRLLKADWSFETVDSDSDVGMYNSLAVDSNNNLHISYYDSSNRRDLKYGYYDGTWHIEVVDSNDLTGTYNSIAVDSTNNPHISYRVGGALKYAYHNGVNWEIMTIDISYYPRRCL